MKILASKPPTLGTIPKRQQLEKMKLLLETKNQDFIGDTTQLFGLKSNNRMSIRYPQSIGASPKLSLDSTSVIGLMTVRDFDDSALRVWGLKVSPSSSSRTTDRAHTQSVFSTFSH